MDVYDRPSTRFNQLLAGVNTRPQARTARGIALDEAGLRFPRPPVAPTQSYGLSPMMQGVAQRSAAPYMSPLAQAMRQTPTPPPPKDATFMQKMSSPQGRALAAAGLTGLELGGYQDRPVSIGQGIAQMGAAAMGAYDKAQAAKAAADAAAFDRQYKASDLAIKAAKAQKSGPFAGTSMTAQSMNTILSLSPKMSAGEADLTERQLYKLAYNYLSKPRVETRQTDQGTTTVKVPGQDMSSFFRPEGAVEGEEIIGQTSAKFTEGQSNAAAFANRMVAGLSIFDELTESGYDPTNLADYLAGNLPGGLSGYATSPQGQSYLAAKEDFITAVLRKESGAAISSSEFTKEDRKYFPQPGEGPEVIEQKRKARKRALESMKAQSGPAYGVLFGEQEETGIPAGSTFIKRSGGTSYFRTPDNEIIAVDE